MNSAFVLVLTVFLVSGEPVDIAVSVHRTMQECMTAATEQKIPGNCSQCAQDNAGVYDCSNRTENSR